jgi:D-cysteine desulfhydrase
MAGRGRRRAAGGGRTRQRERRGGRSVTRRSFLLAGAGAVGALVLTGAGAHYGSIQLNTFAAREPERLAALRGGASSPLLDRFPALVAHVPWRPIGRFPTPIEALPSPEGAADVRLFVKRDDASSGVYGGSKVRKLEHFLADVELGGHRTIVTLGATGTHHGLATALHANTFGFRTAIAMYGQPVTVHVQKNLRGMLAAGAALSYGGGEFGTVRAARRLYTSSDAAGERPYFIVFGGSSRLGTIGHVNAALELAAQVSAGAVPEPDRIFVALGTCGTAAGLAAGLKLAGLRSKVMAVRATPLIVANRFTVRYMANDVLSFLRDADPTLPRVRVGFADFEVVGDQLGGGYGVPGAGGAAAAAWAAGRLELEPTYTAKALAACLAWCRGRARPGESVLYWHTLNSAPFAQATDAHGAAAPLRAVLDAEPL